MPLPFVSRERYDEAKARIAELETRVKELTAFIIERSNKPQPFAMDEDLSKVQPIPGKPTIAAVISEANRSAFQRAQTAGAKSVSEELAEHASVWRR